MPQVFIPVQWRDVTGGVDRLTLDGTNVRQVVQALEQQFPQLRVRILRDDAFTPGLAVSVDGVMTSRLLTSVQPHSEVHFLPALGGG